MSTSLNINVTVQLQNMEDSLKSSHAAKLPSKSVKACVPITQDLFDFITKAFRRATAILKNKYHSSIGLYLEKKKGSRLDKEHFRKKKKKKNTFVVFWRQR